MISMCYAGGNKMRTEEITKSMATAYIDSTINSNLAYRPEFVSNDYRQGKKVLVSIDKELNNCDEFCISVAFIKMSGITPLLMTLKELERKGIPGNAEVCEQISAEDTMDATVGDASEANITEEYADDRSDDKGSYEAYKKMTPLEKAQTYGFRELKSYDTVRSIVQMKFLDMGHIADVDELLEETDLLYKGMCELVVRTKTEEIQDEIKHRGSAFDDLSVIEKARMLQFQPDNNSYNIQLYSAVCKACGVDISDEDKIFEDYQAIYEKTLEMKQEWGVERKDGGRDRAR